MTVDRFGVTSVAARLLCKMENVLPVVLTTAGMYMMVILSVERLRCVLPPSGQEIPSLVSRSIGNVYNSSLPLKSVRRFTQPFYKPHTGLLRTSVCLPHGHSTPVQSTPKNVAFVRTSSNLRHFFRLGYRFAKDNPI